MPHTRNLTPKASNMRADRRMEVYTTIYALCVWGCAWLSLAQHAG